MIKSKIIMKKFYKKGREDMKKQIKKLLCAALSLAMVAGTVVLPTTASAADYTPIFEGDTVLNEWKFDFGAADSTAEDGYTLVTPKAHIIPDNANNYDFGFLGTDAEDYNLTNRYDGWTTQKGQVIELSAGGGTGLNDAIGVTGAGGTADKGGVGNDIFGNKADKYYPTRFGMKVEDDTYYRIRATVTTLDPNKDATVSLYTERKHPLYTEKTIAKGETYTTEFSVRVTPIYYQKSAPEGAIADRMLTVGVLGENSALASVEIQRVESIPTLWVLGDSTVTDGNTTLPFFPLQNYTGVGTGLTKYLPRNIAMVNEGEGGLDADDTLHFNMVKDRIKAGDYMYVEYGHNHKKADHSLDPDDFYNSLKKDEYYNACKTAGAKLLIVSPVQSVASWDDTAKKWSDRFGGTGGMADKGKQYVEEKIAAEADNIAFVDLTKTSVAFVDEVTANGGNVSTAAQFYYRTAKKGSTDPSHPNDAGAENFAYCFFEAAQAVTDEKQKAVIAGLLDGMTDEQPNLVSQEVVEGGVGGTAWPEYTVPSSEKYPVKIEDIVFNDDGTVKQVDVTKREAEIKMDSYGAIIITIYKADGTEKGKLYAINQVDNSTEHGPQTVSAFRGDTILEEGDTYSAVVVEADADVKPVSNGKVYSAVYKPTDIVEHLITNERNEEGYENFDYYGAKYDGKTTDYLNLNGSGWSHIGSAAHTTYLNESGSTKYVTFTSGGDGSYYPVRELDKEIGSSGRYMFSADLQYISGEGMTFKLVTGHNNNHRGGTEGLVLFTVGKDGKITSNGKDIGTISSTGFTNVQYILDIDRGTATVSVGGNEVGASAPVEIPLEGYQTTSLTVKPSKLTQILLGEDKKAFSVSVANLMVAKLKDKELPTYTASIGEYDAAKGSATVTTGAMTGFELAYDGTNAVVTADKASATATLIEAACNADGTLKSVKATPLTFTADALTKPTPVTAGSTLMLWDSLQGMKPLAPAITADNTPAAAEVTASLNTVVTVKAAANDGFVFMGWKDKNDTVVSTDAEYTFRLRDDIELTPNFVKEPSIADITDYKLVADKTSIKAASGAVVNVNITDAKDAVGTPISIATNKDAQWSCDETGVTVTDGVVTFGSEFDMGAAETKTVTIKATLNEIEKTCNITVTIYDYYEDFSGGDLTKTSWFANIGTGSAGIENGELKLNTPSGNNNNNYIGVHFAAPADAANKIITIKFDYKTTGVGTGNGASSIHLADMALTDNAPTWNTTYGDSSSGIDFKAGSEAIGLTADTKYAFTIVVNNKTQSAEVTAQPEGGSALTYTIENTRKAANTIFFRPAKGGTDIVDNVRVTITDAE